MRYLEGIISFIDEDLSHIRDELRRHASVSTASGFSLILLSLPFLFVDDLPAVSSRFIAASSAAFLFFSFLPDILRLFCSFFNCHKFNALSHSFFGALLFSSFFVLVLLPLGIWMPSLFAFCFLGYSLHLFIDSVERVMDWCSHNLQKIFFSLPFLSLRDGRAKTD